MNRILIIAVIAVVALLGGLWWLSGQGPAPGLELQANNSAEETAEADLSLVEEISMGNPDAPVTIIEYGSYTCPHCKSFHLEAFQDLKREYIDTGKINFVYREVYFDQFGLWAGMMARCGGGSDRYFAISDLLYTQQSEWLASGTPEGISDALRRLGKTAGLTDDMLDQCMQDRELAEALVASYQANATEHGIRSTPSFVINGTTHANLSFAEFQRLIAEAGGS